MSSLTGKDCILSPLIKQLNEVVLKAELESHLETDETPHRKISSTSKTIKSPSGSFELYTPRGRAGSFESLLIKKHQTHLTYEIQRKVISMFDLGMSSRDTASHVADLYGLSISNVTISNVTDKLIPEFKQWQQRHLERYYPYIWLDALHYKIKEDGCYGSKAVYTVLGLNLEGKKKFWA